ncbi:MAG: hypothetical protein AB8B81_11620 [Halioglobus sp.]
MKKLTAAIMFLTFAVGLTACGEKDEQPEGVLTSAQEKALEKAEQLEQTVLDAQQEKLKGLDTQKP